MAAAGAAAHGIPDQQRQRSQDLTSASGDAIWGAHRPNYIHGQFGGILFAPQVPPPPRCTPVVVSTKLTSRLSTPAPCCALPARCAGQPSLGHIPAAPRRALLPLGDSIRRSRRSSRAKIMDLSGQAHSNWHNKRPRLDACTPRRARAARRDENLHLADYHRHAAIPLGPLVNPSYSVVVRKALY
jgi:hypothetical protein